MKLFESICGNAQSGSLQSFSQWGWNSTSHSPTSLAFHSKVIWFHLCNIFNFLWSNLLITYFTLLYFSRLTEAQTRSDGQNFLKKSLGPYRQKELIHVTKYEFRNQLLNTPTQIPIKYTIQNTKYAIQNVKNNL